MDKNHPFQEAFPDTPDEARYLLNVPLSPILHTALLSELCVWISCGFYSPLGWGGICFLCTLTVGCKANNEAENGECMNEGINPRLSEPEEISTFLLVQSSHKGRNRNPGRERDLPLGTQGVARLRLDPPPG